MPIAYTTKTKRFCRFKGEDLKAAMEEQGISSYMLAKAIGVYAQKVRDWKASKYVTVEGDIMADINTAIDCRTKKKII
jgi:hypothetical protein